MKENKYKKIIKKTYRLQTPKKDNYYFSKLSLFAVRVQNHFGSYKGHKLLNPISCAAIAFFVVSIAGVSSDPPK